MLCCVANAWCLLLSPQAELCACCGAWYVVGCKSLTAILGQAGRVCHEQTTLHDCMPACPCRLWDWDPGVLHRRGRQSLLKFDDCKAGIESVRTSGRVPVPTYPPQTESLSQAESCAATRAYCPAQPTATATVHPVPTLLDQRLVETSLRRLMTVQMDDDQPPAPATATLCHFPLRV